MSIYISPTGQKFIVIQETAACSRGRLSCALLTVGATCSDAMKIHKLPDCMGPPNGQPFMFLEVTKENEAEIIRMRMTGEI